MKKQILVMLSAGFLAGAALTSANQASAQNQESVAQQDPERKPVAESSLPQTIQDLLNTEYKDWSLQSAFLVNASPAYYEITVANAEGETKLLKLNEQGQPQG